jgi:riboflavin synthase
MFTGIITAVGRLERVVPAPGGGRHARVEVGWPEPPALGASVACAGVCLTVTDAGVGWFAADLSAATLAVTTTGAWEPGRRINLERALKFGDELGGHLVAGHVDGVGRVAAITPEGDHARWDFTLDADLARYVARKGSIAVDGVSLTVNAVGRTSFAVNIIPHTRDHTTFADLAVGDLVNLEADLLARYAARYLDRD